MKLSEVDTSAFLKLLLYGDSGAGKTCFAGGLPLPILYLDFDGKVSSAARYYSDDKDRLAQIEVVKLNDNIGSDPVNELTKIMRDLETQHKSGSMKFKTIVIDSITTFSSACLRHIVKTNPGIKRSVSAQGVQPGMQDYGILKREFARMIPGLLSLNMNVVMLGHIAVTKDENTGELIRGCMMDGSFSEELPIYFEEVWRAYVDTKGNHKAQTQSDYKYKCRSQIKGLPKEISLAYKTVQQYL